MRRRSVRLHSAWLALSLLASSVAWAIPEAVDPAEAARIDEVSAEFLSSVRGLLTDGDPVLACPRCPEPLRIPENFFEELNGRRFLLLLPADQSPYDVRFQVHFRDRARRYETLSIRSNRRDDHGLWLSTTYSNVRKIYDYSLTLELGEGFASHGSGTLEANRIVNWTQNNEYRLIVLTASHDPSDPRFALIIQDELMVNIISAPSPDGLLPTIKPAVSFRPANLGLSMTVGKKSRMKVSVGGGFALSVLPFTDPRSATQGFFRLHFRP